MCRASEPWGPKLVCSDEGVYGSPPHIDRISAQITLSGILSTEGDNCLQHHGM